MDNLTFEQLPAGVSLLLQKIQELEQAMKDLAAKYNPTTGDDRLSVVS